MRKFAKFTVALLAVINILASPLTTLAAVPPSAFGSNNRAIHFNPNSFEVQSVGVQAIAISNTFIEGERIGTLTVYRLNRTVNVYEGETMRNMDKGAGRFSFSGANFSNTALIGHNRGNRNGFFSFVRHLQDGDLVSLEMSGFIRTYEVVHTFIVEETDFTPLMDFGDTRLTLVTCVEYRPRYRRIAKLLPV